MYWDDDLRIIEHPASYDPEREVRLASLLSQCISDYITMQDARDMQGMLSTVNLITEVGMQAQDSGVRWDSIKALERVSGKRWWE